MNLVRFLTTVVLLAPILGCTGEGSGSSGSVSTRARGKAGSVDTVADAQYADRGISEEIVTEFTDKFKRFTAEGKYDAGDVLVVGTSGDADSLNPIISSNVLGRDVYGRLFLSLTRTNPDFSHGPEVAKSWEFSDDRKELTFHLRDDVFWHDGVKTTAHDVKFTHELESNPEVAWGAIKWKEYIEDVVVIDDYTIKYVFAKVYPYQLMDAVVGEILPKHLLEAIPPAELKNAEFNRKPVGNGPYKFKEWKAQQYIEIVANDKFYAGRPPIDRIIFKPIPDTESRVLQLRNGEVDFVERVPPRYARELERLSHLAPHVYPSRGYTYLGWNLKNPLFQSKRVRQAMTMAINRQEIIDALLFEYGEVCTGPISPIIWAHNPDVPDFPYDPEKAKKHLAEEGWADTDGDGWLDKDGQKFSFTLKTNKGNQIREDMVVIIQDMLKKIGVQVTPIILEPTVFFGDLKKKNFEAGIAGWSVALKMDLTTLWHSSSINDKFNFVSYSNPEVDRITDVAKFETDIQKSKKLWWRAQEIIADDQPYTFLFIQKDVNWIHKRFRNVQMKTVSWNYNIQQWWVPKAEQKYKSQQHESR